MAARASLRVTTFSGRYRCCDPKPGLRTGLCSYGHDLLRKVQVLRPDSGHKGTTFGRSHDLLRKVQVLRLFIRERQCSWNSSHDLLRKVQVLRLRSRRQSTLQMKSHDLLRKVQVLRPELDVVRNGAGALSRPSQEGTGAATPSPIKTKTESSGHDLLRKVQVLRHSQVNSFLHRGSSHDLLRKVQVLRPHLFHILIKLTAIVTTFSGRYRCCDLGYDFLSSKEARQSRPSQEGTGAATRGSKG